MSQELDFPSRDDDAETAGPRPVVVVQYRRGWMARIAAPFLIVCAACVVLTLRMKIEDWRGLTAYLLGPERPPAKAEEAPIAEPPRTASTPLALAVPSAVRVKQAPPARPARPPASWKPPVAAPRMMPIAFQPIAPPGSDAQTDRIWDDIRREAASKQDEALAMEAAKARERAEIDRVAPQPAMIPPGPGPGLAMGPGPGPGGLRLAPAMETEDDRRAFREELRRAASSPPGRILPAVRELCDRYGVMIGGDSRRPTTSARAALTASGRRDQIERMRNQGIAEAAILESLIRSENLNRVARGGPKSPEEVVVKATRSLLSVPIRAPVAARETR